MGSRLALGPQPSGVFDALQSADARRHRLQNAGPFRQQKLPKFGLLRCQFGAGGTDSGREFGRVHPVPVWADLAGYGCRHVEGRNGRRWRIAARRDDWRRRLGLRLVGTDAQDKKPDAALAVECTDLDEVVAAFHQLASLEGEPYPAILPLQNPAKGTPRAALLIDEDVAFLGAKILADQFQARRIGCQNLNDILVPQFRIPRQPDYGYARAPVGDRL